MPSKRVSRDLRDLHGALVDLMVLMNRPRGDDALLREAGVVLDRALFPLLIAIDRFGPISVGDLGDRVGRDYTTISRQVAKLAEQGLIERRPDGADRRVNQAAVSEDGRRMVEAVRTARERLAEPLLSRWSEEDFSAFVVQLRRFVDDLEALS